MSGLSDDAERDLDELQDAAGLGFDEGVESQGRDPGEHSLVSLRLQIHAALDHAYRCGYEMGFKAGRAA